MSGSSSPRLSCGLGALRLPRSLLYKLLRCYGWHSGEKFIWISTSREIAEPRLEALGVC